VSAVGAPNGGSSHHGGGLLEQEEQKNNRNYEEVVEWSWCALGLGCESYCSWSEQSVKLVPVLERERAICVHMCTPDCVEASYCCLFVAKSVVGFAWRGSTKGLPGSGARLLEPVPPLGDLALCLQC